MSASSKSANHVDPGHMTWRSWPSWEDFRFVGVLIFLKILFLSLCWWLYILIRQVREQKLLISYFPKNCRLMVSCETVRKNYQLFIHKIGPFPVKWLELRKSTSIRFRSKLAPPYKSFSNWGGGEARDPAFGVRIFWSIRVFSWSNHEKGQKRTWLSNSLIVTFCSEWRSWKQGVLFCRSAGWYVQVLRSTSTSTLQQFIWDCDHPPQARCRWARTTGSTTSWNLLTVLSWSPGTEKTPSCLNRTL